VKLLKHDPNLAIARAVICLCHGRTFIPGSTAGHHAGITSATCGRAKLIVPIAGIGVSRLSAHGLTTHRIFLLDQRGNSVTQY